MPKLLFIDTNIYLDFYRFRNEMKVSFLDHLESIKDSLIITEQVEMEYKKNRQVEILNQMKELKAPPRINVPSVLKNDENAIALENEYNKINESVKNLKSLLVKLFEDPVKNDKVYQVLQRLFYKRQNIDLYRNHENRYELHELAQKRFNLGYPPRKKNDTSFGDSINWEWLIYVAKEKDADIWIVSRDGDYGVTQDNKVFINDWLKQEFMERVKKERKLVLCSKLSLALKEFQLPVTPEEEKEEERVIIEDSVSVTVRRVCIQCGERFELQENEKICPTCAST